MRCVCRKRVGVVAIAAGVNLHGQVATTAVRPEQGDVQRVVAKGLEGSETFRELAARLDASDVVVYVRFARCTGGVPACLMLASAGSGLRRLLVNLDRFGKSESELVGLLAHELQHANEVAYATELRDAASFQKFFERRGWKGSDGFETAHAKEITRKVASEMIWKRRMAEQHQRSVMTDQSGRWSKISLMPSYAYRLTVTGSM